MEETDWKTIKKGDLLYYNSITSDLKMTVEFDEFLTKGKDSMSCWIISSNINNWKVGTIQKFGINGFSSKKESNSIISSILTILNEKEKQWKQ